MEIAELVLKYIEALVWPAVTVGLVWGLRSHIREAFTRMTRLETPAGAIEFETQAREVLNQAEEVATATPPGSFPQGVPVPPPRPWPPYPAGPATDEPPPPERVEEGLGPSTPRGAPEPAQPQPQAPPSPAPQGPPAPLEDPWALPSYSQPPAIEAPYWREELREARAMVDASPVGAVVTVWDALLGVLTDILQLPEHANGPQLSRVMVQAELPPDTIAVFDRLRILRNQAVHGADTVTPSAARDFIESCRHVARLVRDSRRP